MLTYLVRFRRHSRGWDASSGALRPTAIIVAAIVILAGVGAKPASASCLPGYSGNLTVDSHGFPLAVLPATLSQNPMASFATPSTGGNIAIDSPFIRLLRRVREPADIYTTKGKVLNEASCSWQLPMLSDGTDGDHPAENEYDSGGLYGGTRPTTLQIGVYSTLYQNISFSRDFFALIDGIQPNEEFQVTYAGKAYHNRGVRLAVTGLDMPRLHSTVPTSERTLSQSVPTASGGEPPSPLVESLESARIDLYADAWQTVRYLRESAFLQLTSHPAHLVGTIASYASHRVDTAIGKATELPGFVGGGYALGVAFSWSPHPKVRIRYEINPIIGAEILTGIRQEEKEIDTNNQFIGPDGYIRTRPTMTGSWDEITLKQALLRRHELALHLGSEAIPLTMRFTGVWPELRPTAIGSGFDMYDGWLHLAVEWFYRHGAVQTELQTKYGTLRLRADSLDPGRAHQLVADLSLGISF